MNQFVAVICEYIINSNMNVIDLHAIIKSNEAFFTNYMSVDELYSYKINIKIFQKLVLYNYCFNFSIEKLSKNELRQINNYLLTNDKYLDLDMNFDTLLFFNWCKIYNRNNKDKIKIISETQKNNTIIYLNNC
jgi:hypothetical protein